MICLSNLLYLFTLFITQLQYAKCLQESSDKPESNPTVVSSNGPRNIFLISYGINPEVIDNVLENEQIKALVNRSEQVMKIHFNNSQSIDNLYNIVYRSKGKRDVLEKLNHEYPSGSLRKPFLASSLSSSLRESTSSSSEEASKDDSFDDFFDNYDDRKRDDDEDDNDDGEDDNDDEDDDDETINTKRNAKGEVSDNNPSNGHLTANVLRFGSSCTKGASKDCNAACKNSLKDVCKQYRCRGGLKSKFKKECKAMCHKKFSEK